MRRAASTILEDFAAAGVDEELEKLVKALYWKVPESRDHLRLCSHPDVARATAECNSEWCRRYSKCLEKQHRLETDDGSLKAAVERSQRSMEEYKAFILYSSTFFNVQLR